MEKCDLLRVELQRQLQLIEWLLREWKFDEIKTDRDALRQQMAKFENLTPRCAAILKSLFLIKGGLSANLTISSLQVQ